MRWGEYVISLQRNLRDGFLRLTTGISSRNGSVSGDSLTRPSRAYDADHPAMSDLRRKDFAGMATLTLVEVKDADWSSWPSGSPRRFLS